MGLRFLYHMSDFRLQPCPGTIAITTLLEFCSWLKNTSKGVMQVKDILSIITAYREERGWTEYQLAERSGLPQSTISSWYHKNMVPTIPSLEKICTAFDITLSQLFAEEDAPVSLTEAQKKLLERWSRLSEEQQAVVFALIDKM